MSAPRDIIDALECVLSVYFSGVRHNLRAAFILCDGLVELCCYAKGYANQPNPGKPPFTTLLGHTAVGLSHTTTPLGGRLHASHELRNKMHHVNAAATVDAQRCADAILDAVECIEHTFSGTRAGLDDKLKVALRVVRVFSAQGSYQHRAEFQDGMSRHPWRARPGAPRTNETVVRPGLRMYWGLVILDSTAVIETILNRIGAA